MSEEIRLAALGAQAPLTEHQPLSDARSVLGPSLSLSYEEPLHIVRGSGQYLFDERGRRYLDCVNNVAHVGHSEPRVVPNRSRGYCKTSNSEIC